MDRVAATYPSRTRVAVARTLEALLLLVVVATIAYEAVDYSRTGSLLSLWLAVMLALLSFHPLIRRAFRGHALTYLLQAIVLGLTMVTIICTGWEIRRTSSFMSLPIVLLLGAIGLWPETRFRILNGYWRPSPNPFA